MTPEDDVKRISKVRLGKSTDLNFILSSMLKGLYYGNSYFNMIPKKVFMEHYRDFILKLISSSLVFVVTDVNDDDVVRAYYIVSKSGEIAHWVYTRKQWRNAGLAKLLLQVAPTAYSHFTDLGLKLIKEKLPNAQFNPFEVI